MEDLWVLTEATRKDLARHIMSVSLDQPLTVVISEKMAKRSELQNKYLFGWIYRQLSSSLQDAGICIRTNGGDIPWTKDTLHEVFKVKFLLESAIESRGGKTLHIYRSTTQLNKKEFSEFVQNVKNLSRDFWGIDIPEPPAKSIYDAWRE